MGMKSNSGLFKGMNGSRKLGGTRKELRRKVSTWAYNTADRLSKTSNTQRNKFNTATVIYDESTGKTYYGRNHSIEIDHEKKNPILFGDSTHEGLLPKTSLNDYPLGNCAEMHAVNKALNDGANLKNLKMYTIHTTKSRFGASKHACKNSTYTLKGKIKENYSGWEGE